MTAEKHRRLLSREILWVVCFLIAGIILYTSGLGDLPLRDWDEGIVAGVARNIWRAEPGSQTWLYPTINYGDPYWNKPPLIHCLIALSYRLFGVSEWSTRLVPALLSACSIPLLYLAARELFVTTEVEADANASQSSYDEHAAQRIRADRLPDDWQSKALRAFVPRMGLPETGFTRGRGDLAPRPLTSSTFPSVNRSTAIFSPLVYLTLLPIARHGRVAMLDGAIACWFCLGLWCLLRGRKRYGWLIGTGIALGAICLTKGMMMGLLLGGILIIFIAWDSPKMLSNPYLWAGLWLGVLPAIAWYLLQYWHYGAQFLGINLGSQTFDRIWSPVSTVSAPPWYYLLEIAKYSLPWLIFLPHGIKLAVRNRHLSWGKLTLVWGGIYLLAISLMRTKLPWYIIPIYPVFSLLVGASLARIWHKKQISYFWQISLSLIAVICCFGSIYYGLLAQTPQVDLASIFLIVGISFTLAAILLWLRRRQFILVMAGGFYLALLLLFNSNHWLWELNSDFPVQPTALMLQQNTPPRHNIYTNYPQIRPSLEFYSDRVVLPKSNEQLKQLWQQSEPAYFLIILDISPTPKLKDKQLLASGASWQLITRHRN